VKQPMTRSLEALGFAVLTSALGACASGNPHVSQPAAVVAPAVAPETVDVSPSVDPPARAEAVTPFEPRVVRNESAASTGPRDVSRKEPRPSPRRDVTSPWPDGQGSYAWLDHEVANAAKHRHKICQDDVLSGATSAKCKRATEALSRAVTEAIAKGRISSATALETEGLEHNPLR